MTPSNQSSIPTRYFESDILTRTLCSPLHPLNLETPWYSAPVQVSCILQFAVHTQAHATLYVQNAMYSIRCRYVCAYVAGRLYVWKYVLKCAIVSRTLTLKGTNSNSSSNNKSNQEFGNGRITNLNSHPMSARNVTKSAAERVFNERCQPNAVYSWAFVAALRYSYICICTWA